jgi:L-ribulose-5-phosphate 4-epimerase
MSKRSKESEISRNPEFNTIIDCLWLNQQLPKHDLVKLTWGNASVLQNGKLAIKPSGVPFDELDYDDISVFNFNSMEQTRGLKPSVDLAIHEEIYKAFREVGAIIHTHSTYATAWAQAAVPIAPMGTTHADHFLGEIPVTRHLSSEELDDYERSLGKVVVETLHEFKLTPAKMPAVLLTSHGCVVMGKSKDDAIANAVALEEVAKMAFLTQKINAMHGTSYINAENRRLFGKHFERKNGVKKYYGQ